MSEAGKAQQNPQQEMTNMKESIKRLKVNIYVDVPG